MAGSGSGLQRPYPYENHSSPQMVGDSPFRSDHQFDYVWRDLGGNHEEFWKKYRQRHALSVNHFWFLYMHTQL